MRRCGRSCCAARTVAHQAAGATEPRARTVGVDEPSSERTRTPRARSLPVAAGRRTLRTGHAKAFVLRRDDLADATPQLETPTLRDQRRWSYAPCGLLLALALKRPYTVGTMMPHGRRSPFHRLEPSRPLSVLACRRGTRLKPDARLATRIRGANMTILTPGGLEADDRMLDPVHLERLRQVFRGELIRRGHAGYESARRVWNGNIDRRPALIARCTGCADVQRAVEFAQRQGLQVSVRGGGITRKSTPRRKAEDPQTVVAQDRRVSAHSRIAKRIGAPASGFSKEALNGAPEQEQRSEERRRVDRDRGPTGAGELQEDLIAEWIVVHQVRPRG